jgi:phage terminase small subunit
MTRPFSKRKARFIEEFLRGGNATQSYVTAGYSPNGATQAAHKLLISADVAAEVAKRRSAVMVQLERTTIATLGEAKEVLTSILRGGTVEAMIQRLENAIEGLPPIDQIETLIEIARLKLAQSAEAGRAAMALARLKGALDPARKPLPDRKAALDSLMMTLVKSTDGHALAAQMRAVGFTDVGL